MNEQKIREVFSDEVFVKELLALETPEEVQKALADKDIEMSVEEVKQLGELLVKKANGELSDQELGNVAGGSFAAVAVPVVTIVSVLTGGGASYAAIKQGW